MASRFLLEHNPMVRDTRLFSHNFFPIKLVYPLKKLLSFRVTVIHIPRGGGTGDLGL